MKDVEMREVLVKILKAIGSRRFIWRIEESAGLRVYGIDCDVRDIDITTNDEGIEVFREVLKEWIIEKSYNEEKEHHLFCKIEGIEVEIHSCLWGTATYGNKKSLMLEKTEKKIWKGLRLPVLPLSYARTFYKSIGKEDKVKMIEEFRGVRKV